MKIKLGKKLHKGIKAVSGSMKEYKKYPGDLNAAVYAALWKAKKIKENIIIIPGNSYMNRIFHLSLEKDSLLKYTVSLRKIDVYVATSEGDVYEATATEEKMTENLVEKYLNEELDFIEKAKELGKKAIKNKKIITPSDDTEFMKMLKKVSKSDKMEVINAWIGAHKKF